MPWLDEVLLRLTCQPCCGYRAEGPPAVEPTALAAMALAAHGRHEAARRALEWLARVQMPDGTLGITATLRQPHWPTGWALLAWSVAEKGDWLRGAIRRDASGDVPATVPVPLEKGDWLRGAIRRDASGDVPATVPVPFFDFNPMIRRAAAWLLSFKGRSMPRSPEIGHDTTIEAWPWVEGTHPWVEPTAINLLALKASGFAQHVRSRDAVRMLCDRPVPGGGWNYGSREVFGVPLRPHVQPTGLALAALAGEESAVGQIASATDYLRKTLTADVATASLCYALIGLAAHGQGPRDAPAWLEAAAQRTLGQGGPPYQLALLGLASGHVCPWLVPAMRLHDPGSVPLLDRCRAVRDPVGENGSGGSGQAVPPGHGSLPIRKPQ